MFYSSERDVDLVCYHICDTVRENCSSFDVLSPPSVRSFNLCCQVFGADLRCAD